MRNINKENEFIEKAIKIHGNKYDYSKVEYKGCNEKVCIICPEHGEFWQTPRSHLRGSGCPECGKNRTINSRKKTLKQTIIDFNKVHNNRYDYFLIKEENIKNNKSKIPIICPIHGVFYQSISKHLNGQGCPKCYGNIKKTTEDFINEALYIHGNKYDYTKVKYEGNNHKVEIICLQHGSFFQTPKNHLKGQGCPECAKLKIKVSETKPFGQFVAEASIVHKQKYCYDNNTYISSRDKIKIICPEHGEFWQQVDSHLRGCGCPKCAKHFSKPENDIVNLIRTFYEDEILTNTRNIIPPQELDIYIPTLKIGIEYNGLIWHSEYFNKDKKYHLNKLNLCNSKGIKLIQIFEDEYLEHKDIVFEKIRHLLNKDNDKEKIFARKCIIKEIDMITARNFLEKNHIQGFSSSTIYLGCYYNDDLIGVMTFKKELKDNNRWELTRFATDISKHCIGVGGKLFNYFINTYNPTYIKSFADRRWTLDKDDNLYTKLGFKLSKISPPDYRYVNGLKREHKFGYRKQTLIKKYPDKGLTMDMTEKEMCDKLGFYRIYDCGLLKFIWEN